MESAATAGTGCAERRRASSRVIRATRAEEGAFRRAYAARATMLAAEDAAALERALVECGCASTLDELERLDADASRVWSPTRFHLAVSSPSRFSSWNAC